MVFVFENAVLVRQEFQSRAVVMVEDDTDTVDRRNKGIEIFVPAPPKTCSDIF
jgi:hypothetical protein